jgi:hypothetical protein
MEKTTVKARVDLLEALVEELLKESPRETTIEKKMNDLEIPYSNDPVERINRVLEALHPHQVLDFQGE